MNNIKIIDMILKMFTADEILGTFSLVLKKFL